MMNSKTKPTNSKPINFLLKCWNAWPKCENIGIILYRKVQTITTIEKWENDWELDIF